MAFEHLDHKIASDILRKARVARDGEEPPSEETEEELAAELQVRIQQLKSVHIFSAVATDQALRPSISILSVFRPDLQRRFDSFVRVGQKLCSRTHSVHSS